MTDEKQFLQDFSAWVDDQVRLMAKAEQLAKVEKQEEAAIRYESRLDAYRYLQGKFDNYRAGKGFHDFSAATNKEKR